MPVQLKSMRPERAGFSIVQAANIVDGIVNSETTSPFFNSYRDTARVISKLPAPITP